jgi:DNA-binding transcriptional ArsR family regulator
MSCQYNFAAYPDTKPVVLTPSCPRLVLAVMLGRHGRARHGWGRARLFRLLGTETRHRILEMLRGRALTVGEIADRLAITQPSTSQHLAAMRDAGLVRSRRQGQYVYYELIPEVFSRYRLGTTAFGLGPGDRARTGQLEQYRRFLLAELARVEKTIGEQKQDEQDSA